ncbi:succinate dehydrogenase, hydrophobic membrane anchor protein [Salinispirillum sp. LH 10-3-1]|uniref:Succinate dehydrogenase hydrophobic membrane anchor subunit n=1 Tax=Salinispirillum sp. LH 10-3-1 TaxID=2952525 RepID=A0AB38YJH0_9GAMM
MVSSVTNFSRNGLSDWIIQRLSAVVLAAYTLFMVAYFLVQPEWSYEAWTGLFAQGWMKLFTLLTILAVIAHAWIGMWTVATDYIKSTGLRLAFLVILGLVLFVYFVVAFDAVWGV